MRRPTARIDSQMTQLINIPRLIKASTLVFDTHSLRNQKNRLQFILKGLSSRKSAFAGLNDAEIKGLDAIIQNDPIYLGFLVWPFLHKDLTTPQKFQHIVAHHRAVQAHFPWLHLSSKQEIVLAPLDTYYENLRVVVEDAPWFIREGALNFSLMLGNIRLMTIAFCIEADADGICAYIGALQGSADTPQETYKTIADACCDLRPRDLTFKLIRIFLNAAGIQRVKCIADDNRAVHHTFFGQDKTVAMRYNDLWIDQGGTLTDDGYYLLPTELQERPLSEVPQKKRGRYKRRLEMFEQVSVAVRARIAELSAH